MSDELEAKKSTHFRETFKIGSETFALDIYPGAVPPLTPGDIVIVDKKLPDGSTLLIVKKGTTAHSPPTVQDLTTTTKENQLVIIDLTHSITVEAPATLASVTITTLPTHGKAQETGPEKISYTPNTGFNGNDAFMYKATDSVGATSATAEVRIAVGVAPPPPPPDVDAFGVKKLYSDGPGPATLMDMDDPTKTRGASPGNNPEGNQQYYPKFVKNADGSWKNTNGLEVRWAWCAEGNYPGDSNICKCYDTDNHTGNMGNPGDWPPRVEVTAYYKSDAGSVGTGTHNGECHIEHVVSGHRSTTSSTPSGPGGCQEGCAGSYHHNKYPKTGRQKMEKDYHHSFAYGQDIAGVNNNTATPVWGNDGKWHGFKDVWYISGTTTVHEQWTDWNADQNWKKTHSFIDHGQWTPKQAYTGCGSGPQTIVFMFGGPLIVFRADNWNFYSMKNLSIRSIDPTKPLMGAEHAMEFEADDTVVEEDSIYQEEAWRTELA